MITPLPLHLSLAQASRSLPMLSKDDEMDLVVRAKAGDHKATERLVLSHLRMVVSSARRFAPNADPNDLVQEGVLGLMRALESFDLTKGVRFSTYAREWMRERQLQHTQNVRSSVMLGQGHARRRATYHLTRTMEAVEQEARHQGQNPTRRDILERAARLLDIAPDEAEAVLSRGAGDMSLNTPVSHSDEGESLDWIDTLSDESGDVESAIDRNRSHEAMGEAISRALGCLSERERRIVVDRHLSSNPPTLETLGAQMNVSKERIRQIEARALEKMSEALGGNRHVLLSLMGRS
jgi:RNA polymerase sigma-32 factor